jgi:hypothetical protein
MRKRLATIVVLLAASWLVTATAEARIRWHNGPPPVGAGSGRLHMPGK